jgi:hypothetical protein
MRACLRVQGSIHHKNHVSPALPPICVISFLLYFICILTFLSFFRQQLVCFVAMKHCDHSHWFGLYMPKNEITFTYSDRAQTLLYSLPYLETQRPSLFILIGNSGKALALRELAPGNVRKKSLGRRRLGELHLHIDPSSTFSDRPVLFADGDFPVYQKPSKQPLIEKCHDVTSKILLGLRDGGPSKSLQNAANSLYLSLLSPFADVFCLFAGDFGGLQPVARLVASWLEMDQPPVLPTSTLPHIIIVVESPVANLPESPILESFLQLLYEETTQNVYAQFAKVQILILLPDGDLSTESRHRRLKERLMSASDQVRSARMASRALFSAQHLAAFLDHACSHFGASLKKPFNPIETSRLDYPPAPDLKEHLTNFLVKIKSPQELKSFAIPVIASSILLDNYPPEMHRE